MAAKRRMGIAIVLACIVMGGCSTGSRLTLAQRDRAARFDDFWNLVDQRYPFLEGDGVAWNEVRDMYRPRAILAGNELEFYRTLWMAASFLDDGHVSVNPPRAVLDSAGVAGLPDMRIVRAVGTHDGPNGIGHFVLTWGEGERPVAPPHLDGDREVPQLMEVEGVPFGPWRQSRKLFLAAPGHRVELRLRWSDGTESRHFVTARPRKNPLTDGLDRGEPQRIELDDDRELYLVHVGDRVLLVASWTGLLLSRIDDLEVNGEDGQTLRTAWFLSRALDIPSADRGEPRGSSRTYTRNTKIAEEHLASQLRPAGGLSADVLLLDLRENHGGDAETVRVFLDALAPGPVTIGASHDGNLAYVVKSEGGLEPLPPMVVLVNAGSISAAELLAAALQEHARATVVGAPTIGSVGTTFHRHDRAEEDSGVSVPQWLTVIDGASNVQRRGVLPDVPMLPSINELRDLRAASADGAELVERYTTMIDQRWDRAIELGVRRAASMAHTPAR